MKRLIMRDGFQIELFLEYRNYSRSNELVIIDFKIISHTNYKSFSVNELQNQILHNDTTK